MRSVSIVSLPLAVGVLSLAACAYSSSTPGSSPSPAIDMSTSPPSPDPRVGLRAGWYDAGQAIWNLEVVSKTRPSPSFSNPTTPGDSRLWNSDISFWKNYVFQGSFSGYQVWDISNPRKPALKTAYVCPGSQSDVSVYHDLLFVSGEDTRGRIDCGMQGVTDTVSKERLRGIRIFDITDVGHPKYLANVQTCRGSHTHTVVTDPNDKDNVYIYISGTSSVRSPGELAGCSGARPDQDPNSALFRIEVIRVPLAHPELAKIVSSPRIFEDLAPPARHGEVAADSVVIAAARAARNVDRAKAAGLTLAQLAAADSVAGAVTAGRGPTQCHDITVYPAIGLAGGACAGYGLLIDIRDAANPKRLAAAADSNFSFWHSATFNNDGTKILFSDEWGGGTQPRCRASDKYEWGADAIFTLADNKMTFQSYYKMPAAQTPYENCVAHNGTLIPVPGRDIMVQAWYQGGVSVFDWTDAAHPKEIAFYDMGPMDSTKFVMAGYWSTYWYNGYIVASEISRGLDIFQLKPSALLSQNEIDAAKLVHFDYFNAQDQPKIVWPASFVVARAYLDQLVRGNGISSEQSSAIARDLAAAEKADGTGRKEALMRLANQLDNDAGGAADSRRVRMMATAVRALLDAQSSR